MTVDRKDIDQMTKFLSATQGFSDMVANSGGYSGLSATHVPETMPAELRQYGISSSQATRVAPPVSINTSDVNEMKSILTRFYQATENVVSEASYDRPLREAINMEETKDGARMGQWEIKVKTVGKAKLYDVMHATTRECIASELTIYEAAYGLVRKLNEGGKINSLDVINMLQAEQTYASAIHDMRVYKYHLNNSPNSPKKPIYEDRYTSAKRKAISARTQVEKLAGDIL